MTTTTRASAAPPTRTAGSHPVRSPVVLGALGAAQAATASLLCVLAPVMLVWVSAGTTGAVWTEAVRAGTAGWLLAHHAPVRLDEGGRLSLVPLALTLLPVAWCWFGGRRLGDALRTVAATSLRRHGLRALGAFTALYAVLAVGAGVLTGTPDANPSAGHVLVGSSVVAGASAGTAMLRTVLAARDDRRGVLRFSADVLRLPVRVRAVARAAVVAVGVWVAAAGVLTAAALLLGQDRVAAVREVVAPGWAGVGVGVIELAYLPTAVLWAAAWLAGPGFAVGTGTAVGPAAVTLGPLPALPVLGALPEPGVLPAWWWAGTAVPVLAGVLAGLRLSRHAPALSRTDRLVLAPAVGAAAGTLGGLLAWTASGSVGYGRMLELGPSAVWVGLALTLEVGAGALVAVLLTGSGRAAASDAVPAGAATPVPATGAGPGDRAPGVAVATDRLVAARERLTALVDRIRAAVQRR